VWLHHILGRHPRRVGHLVALDLACVRSAVLVVEGGQKLGWDSILGHQRLVVGHRRTLKFAHLAQSKIYKYISEPCLFSMFFDKYKQGFYLNTNCVSVFLASGIIFISRAQIAFVDSGLFVLRGTIVRWISFV